MLIVNNLSYIYSNGKGIFNLTFEGSGIFGLAGLNGSGKTTFFNCVSGLFPYSGNIFLDENELDTQVQKLAYLPTEDYFFPELTGRQNLKIVGELKYNDKNLYMKYYEDIKALDLINCLDDFFRSYSTGMKKKIQMIPLFFSSSPIILLDEPSNGVDLLGNTILKQWIQKWKTLGRTVLISSHILEQLTSFSDQIILLQEGRVKKILFPPYQNIEEYLKQ